ncbi:ribose-5-phosphate isomerase RpiA [Candidatus Micrarchaeota archaeon]|nr:ribose-5-phosphate isomerase RpiA [Candidatus Micrarchaeota archaeon]MBD3417486.1 ribose-5-phosphate isomerase RpiA [Candidatus Micrarchaeota archaeon]
MTAAKENAARGALEYVEDGMVVGLGSGTTTAYFVEMLGAKMKDERISAVGVVTSFDTEILAKKAGIPVMPLEGKVDIAIDGADIVGKRYVLKGGGGALTREKIVDYAAEKFIVIADEGKADPGKSYPVVLEVVPFAYQYVMGEVRKLGLEPELRVGGKKLGPVVTDNSNFILDCRGEVKGEPEEFEKILNVIPGVVENGVFSKYWKIIIGNETGHYEI